MERSGTVRSLAGSRHAICPTSPPDDSRSRKCTVALTVAALALAGGPHSVKCENGPDAPEPSASLAIVDPVGTHMTNYRLDRGDRLRVRFFDRFDRNDLNGEYVLGEGGQLRLPRIGIFEARNKSTTELEKDVKDFTERKGEKLGYFSIDVIECRPLYVGGLVNRPGAYPYVPGMTVLHSVAVAGGIYRSPNSSASDALKERSRLAEALERLKELIARRARLEAERDNRATVSVPDELLELEPIRAGKMIELERNLLQRQRETTNRDREGLENFASLTDTEAESYQASIASITKRIGEQASLIAELQRLYNKQLITQQRYFEAVTALETVERDRNLAVANLAHAKASIEKTKRDIAMLTLANNARVSKELAETEQEIMRLKTIVSDARSIIQRLDMLSGEGRPGPSVLYRIMRRDSNGAISFVRGSETALVAPDDVVQVELRPQNDSNGAISLVHRNETAVAASDDLEQVGPPPQTDLMKLH